MERLEIKFKDGKVDVCVQWKRWKGREVKSEVVSVSREEVGGECL